MCPEMFFRNKATCLSIYSTNRSGIKFTVPWNSEALLISFRSYAPQFNMGASLRMDDKTKRRENRDKFIT